jgi:hypothetical protein
MLNGFYFIFQKNQNIEKFLIRFNSSLIFLLLYIAFPLPTAVGQGVYVQITPDFVELDKDVRAFSTLVGERSAMNGPTFNGSHGALMQRALSVEAFKELNEATRLLSPGSPAPVVQSFQVHLGVLKLLTQRYERLFNAEPQKYALEHLRISELNIIRSIGSVKSIVSNTPSAKSADPNKQLLVDIARAGNIGATVFLRNGMTASLKEVATHISTGAYVGEAKTAGQAFLTRYLVELKDILTDAQQAEIKQLGGLS